MRGWPRLPSWAVGGALPLSAEEVERIESLSGLRCLMALHIMAAFPEDVGWPPSIVCAHREIRSYSGLGRTSVKKAIGELERRDVVRVLPGVGRQSTCYTLHRAPR